MIRRSGRANRIKRTDRINRRNRPSSINQRNSEVGKEVEKNETKSSVSDQWKEIERLNELNILLMSKRQLSKCFITANFITTLLKYFIFNT